MRRTRARGESGEASAQRARNEGAARELEDGTGTEGGSVNVKKRRKKVENVDVIHVMKEPRRRESRAMASERRQTDVREERAKRKREEEERKEERREAKQRREESWGYMLRHPKQGGSNLRVAIRVGPKALDKIADGREGWIGQGSAMHRTRKRKRD